MGGAFALFDRPDVCIAERIPSWGIYDGKGRSGWEGLVDSWSSFQLSFERNPELLLLELF